MRTIINNADLTAGVEVRKNGRPIYQETKAAGFHIGNSIADSPEVTQIKPGTNITGGNTAEVLVGYGTGGAAHCCYGFLIFELGPEFRLLAKANAGN